MVRLKWIKHVRCESTLFPQQLLLFGGLFVVLYFMSRTASMATNNGLDLTMAQPVDKQCEGGLDGQPKVKQTTKLEEWGVQAISTIKRRVWPGTEIVDEIGRAHV